MVSALSIPLFLIGFPLAFAGWRIYEMAIMFIGGMSGMGLGYIAGVFMADPITPSNPEQQLPKILGAVGLVAGFSVAYVAHRLVHGLTGFAAAALIGYLMLDSSAAALFLGLGGGYATWLFHKVSVIVLTSTIGGLMVSIGFGLQDTAGTQLLLAGGVAVLGMVVQFGLFGTRTESAQPGSAANRGCPACGHPCGADDRYCEGCGTGLASCGSCGSLGLAEWEFCDACGNPLNTG